MPTIHPTASVDPACTIADDAVIGPWCVLTGPVTLGPSVRLIGNVYIQGPAAIGARTIIYPFAALGFEPQDYKYKPGMKTAGVAVGEDCLIREQATIHAATREDRPTRMGNACFLMVNSHLAHDVQVADRVVMVNGTGIAGHSEIASDVTFGGNAVVHQHCRIGRLVMMSGDCAVSLDVPPFCMVSERNRIGGLNTVGLRRAGLPREHITELRRAFRDFLRRPMPRAEVIAALKDRGAHCPPVAELADFIAQSKRGITPGMGKPPRDSMKQDATDED
jgi:UDP-N-acetylglucosamine acyltransferase